MGVAAIPPKPLSSFRAGFRRPLIFTSTSVAVRERPKHAILAAKIIGEAAELDYYFSSLLVSLLGSKAKPSFAMFDAIHQTAKNSALKAAARACLAPEDNDTFAALSLLAKAADKHRNRLAHWLWAYSEDIDDGLLFVDPSANFEFLVNVNEKLEKGERVIASSKLGLDYRHVLVYSLKDLTDAAVEYANVSEWLRCFNMHIHPHLMRDEAQYRLMLASPAFRQALARVQKQSRPQAQKALKSKLQGPDAE